MVIGPYEELQTTAATGPRVVELLYKTVRAVAHFDNYPPPPGHQRWSWDAIHETAHEFLAGIHGTDRVSQLYVLAIDDPSLARLLQAAVRNFFRSQARATLRGRLARRLKSILSSTDTFVPLQTGEFGPDQWHLARHKTPRLSYAFDELVTAAMNAEVKVAARDPSGATDTIDRKGLTSLCETILDAVPAAVLLNDLLEAIALRIGLWEPPLIADLDNASPHQLALDPANEVIARTAAEAVFNQLTDRERLLILVIDHPVREAAEFLGLGKSATAQAMIRLKAKMTELLDPDDDETVRELTQIVTNWKEQWTSSPHLASGFDEEES